MKAGFCKDDQLGEFILSSNSSESKNPIISQAVHIKDPGEPLRYEVKRTGFYCVRTFGYTASEYKAVVEFRNAYGELPAAQIAKLPFYGGLTIVYAVIGMRVLPFLKYKAITNIQTASGPSCTCKIAMTYVSSRFCRSWSLVANRISTRTKLHYCYHCFPHC